MVFMDQKEFNWNHFLQPYELAVEGFILKIEGIKKQYQLRRSYCPIEIVTGRVKSPDSILDKARRMDVEFENISKKVYDKITLPPNLYALRLDYGFNYDEIIKFSNEKKIQN